MLCVQFPCVAGSNGKLAAFGGVPIVRVCRCLGVREYHPIQGHSRRCGSLRCRRRRLIPVSALRRRTFGTGLPPSCKPIAHVQAGTAAQASIAAALAYVWSEIAIGSFYHIFWEISGLSFDAVVSKKAYAYINFGSTAATLFIGLVGVLTPAVCASAAAASRSPGC